MLNSVGFDLWADGYDQSVGVSDSKNTYPFAGYKKGLNIIYNEVLTKPYAEVLDIGFGTGTLTSKLYQQGCKIYGIDFSIRMIELAQEKMPNAVLEQGDFSNGLTQKLQQHTYDYIIATYCLHHLKDSKKVEFVTELLHLLKENGKILVGDIAFENRRQLELCQKECQNAWDEEEIYWVYDEIKPYFGEKLNFTKVSHCAGILEFVNRF